MTKKLLEVRREYKPSSTEYDEVLREAMQWLWDRIVSKVVQKLHELGIAKGSRIWWCPTSVLTALPFHAAGPFRSADGAEKYLLDDYICSYTPTLNSLIQARSGYVKGKLKMTVVGDMSLPSAKRELEAIDRFKLPCKQLVGDLASRESVLKSMGENLWIHFTCHGLLDETPFNCAFKLSDGKLTLLDIIRAHVPNAEFAFLSVCHSAEQSRGGIQDEVLHLAAAIQFCGFRSVIGTMWQLFDGDGPDFAKEVYVRMGKKLPQGEARYSRAAGALRDAAQILRGKGVSTERWVNVVHIGA